MWPYFHAGSVRIRTPSRIWYADLDALPTLCGFERLAEGLGFDVRVLLFAFGRLAEGLIFLYWLYTDLDA